MVKKQRLQRSLKKWSSLFRRVLRRVRGVNERCITLAPKTLPARGRVLFSYIVDGVLVSEEAKIPYSHVHFWETWAMVQCFREAGFTVDVIHWTRRRPLPRLDYDIFVDVRRNFSKHAKMLPDTCLKIAHMDTAHWRVHNGNQMRRLEELRQRRGISLAPFKLIEENDAAENADLITVLGNDFTIQSFEFANKPVRRIPLSNARQYPFPEGKEFATARRRFLWFGSEGFVHKGLDLVLDAFAELPDHELYICGPLYNEPEFTSAFARLLFDAPNIHTLGWVDVGRPEFVALANQCLGIIYPSCSEGGGGCVLTAMHVGLIPIVSLEASVDVSPEYGVLLKEASIESIKGAVRALSETEPDQLRAMAYAAWSWVRAHHTRERFKKEYAALVDEWIQMKKL